MAKNLIDDTLNFGVGLFAYSRDRIEKMVEKMVDAGQVERKDAANFAHEMVQAGEEQRKEVKKMVRDEVRENLEALGLTNSNGTAANQQLTAQDIREIIREELKACNAGKDDTAAAAK